MRAFVTAAAAIACASSLVGCAARPSAPYTARLVDAANRPLAEVQSSGHTVAIGKPGQVYQVEVSNNTDDPVGVFLSIDGLDGSNGRPAAWEPAVVVYRSAHHFAPWTYNTLEGFDLTPTTKSSYGFIDAPHSYAAQAGVTAAIGRIEVGFYALVRDDRPWTNPHDPDDYAVSPLAPSPTPSAPAPTTSFGKVSSSTENGAAVPYRIDGQRELRRLVLYYAGEGALALGTVGPSPDAETLGRRAGEPAAETQPIDGSPTPASEPPAVEPTKPGKPGKPGKAPPSKAPPSKSAPAKPT